MDHTKSRPRTRAIDGAIIGAVIGFFGSSAAMAIAGGGNSRNDICFGLPLGLVLGLATGAVFGPAFISAAVAPRPRRGGPVTTATRVVAVLSIFGFLGASLTTGGALYHALVIADLSPDLGGPFPNPDPAARRMWALVLAVVSMVAAVGFLCLVLRLSGRGGSDATSEQGKD